MYNLHSTFDQKKKKADSSADRKRISEERKREGERGILLHIASVNVHISGAFESHMPCNMTSISFLRKIYTLQCGGRILHCFVRKFFGGGRGRSVLGFPPEILLAVSLL